MLTRSRARRRTIALDTAGFSLAETLVAVAVTGVVASVVLTQVVTPARNGDAGALVATITGVTEAVQRFRGDVGRYPAELRILSRTPQGGHDSCGRSLPPELLARWRGPYLQQLADEDGLSIGDLVIRNAVRPEPATRSVAESGVLYLDVTGVDRPTAAVVEEDFDGREDFAGGSVRWSPTSDSDTGTLSYGIPIRGC